MVVKTAVKYLEKEFVKAAKKLVSGRNKGPHLRGAINAPNNSNVKPTVAEVKDIVAHQIGLSRTNMYIDYAPTSYQITGGQGGRRLLYPAAFLPQIPTGTTNGQRVGNRVEVRGYRVNFEVSNGANYGARIQCDTKVILARWRFPNGTTTVPTYTDLPTYREPVNPEKWSVVQTLDFKIHSEMLSVANQIYYNKVAITKYLKLPKTFKYIDSTTQLPSNLPYYFMLVTNSPDNTASSLGDENVVVNIQGRLYYENK